MLGMDRKTLDMYATSALERGGREGGREEGKKDSSLSLPLSFSLPPSPSALRRGSWQVMLTETTFLYFFISRVLAGYHVDSGSSFRTHHLHRAGHRAHHTNQLRRRACPGGYMLSPVCRTCVCVCVCMWGCMYVGVYVCMYVI